MNIHIDTQSNIYNLKKNIDDYCKLDDKIININKQAHILRQSRSSLENTIILAMRNIKPNSKQFTYGEEVLSIIETKEKPGMSMSLIKDVTITLFGEEPATKLLEEIISYRNNNKTHSLNLKRRRQHSKRTMRNKLLPKTNNNHYQSLKNK